MNLHIVDDEKFINGSIDLFEKHDPKQNIFVVNSASKQLNYVLLRKEVVVLRLSNLKDASRLNKIVKDNSVNKVFVHLLSPLKATLSNNLRKKHGVKLYWIFYGADLYSLLAKEFGYQLHDIEFKNNSSVATLFKSKANLVKFYIRYKETSKNSILDFIKNLDYFCFWNNYDFELLKKYYVTNAVLLNFIYFNALDRSEKELKVKNEGSILVNNSASKNGNHATILNKIKIVDKDQTVSKIICPLSYGNPEIVNKTTKLGEILFEDKFNPLLDFLDKDSYFSLIEDVSVAFFGHRRQEAASNISQLLGNGVKVFLRNDNNIMLFMRDKGFLVFSFEDDFNSIEDLNPLTMAQMIQNQNAFLKMVNEKEEYLMMTKIIKS
jgi:hypothetical protein